VDQSTGKPTVRYLWDNVIIEHVELSGSIVARSAGLTLIEKDLRNSLKWLRRARSIALDTFQNDEAQTYVAATNREAFDDVKGFL